MTLPGTTARQTPAGTADEPPVIEVRDLVKEFRRPVVDQRRFGALRQLLAGRYELVRAVDGVTFSVPRGQVIGYLGPNGAGKSTTIKMLTGVLEPTSGTVRVNGVAPSRNRKQNALRVGAVFGQRSQLWWDLPLVESMRLLAALYRIEPGRYRDNLARVDRVLGLRDFLDTPVRQLSLGQRMRGDLAAAVLHDPTVLYLDEPTIGLDVYTKDRVCDFIADISSRRGTTIVLTTHDLADVERLCHRVVLIDHGTVVFDGTVDALKDSYLPERTLTVRYESGPRAPFAAGRRLAGGTVVRCTPNEAVVRMPPEGSVPAVLTALEEHCRVVDLSIAGISLETVVKQLYPASGAAE
ncbi:MULTISPECIES: ABC transporter ATP-binding protein [unclassified Streptomyces]|uniref:ABC transporter ATP-binding protein n=1 Tax=unclassified Streptomyces TaxID=2593676 RepID=UPI000DAEC312|nr:MULTISPECIES: ATP-binding cassette domain-containing protein [unclassified Streptomyces]PZT72142.1 ABC transporter ATP-binding protein [Streptomyces sp. AC1-42T]PZT81537.1 ABC transporter ATP-binding protein [Streptomyces sp. AC1-42W]